MLIVGFSLHRLARQPTCHPLTHLSFVPFAVFSVDRVPHEKPEYWVAHFAMSAYKGTFLILIFTSVLGSLLTRSYPYIGASYYASLSDYPPSTPATKPASQFRTIFDQSALVNRGACIASRGDEDPKDVRCNLKLDMGPDTGDENWPAVGVVAGVGDVLEVGRQL